MRYECCYVGPRRHEADWIIIHGPAPDDYTESCGRHLVKMLTDAPEHKLYPITSEDKKFAQEQSKVGR